MSRARIVIIGAGFAGAYCAQALERRLRAAEADITLIDRQNYFIFFPLLIEAGTGNVEPRHAVVAIRSFLRRAEFRTARVTGVDLQAREVVCEFPDGHEKRIGYDHLVVALGSVTRKPDIPGLREHALEIKSLPDAVALRDRAIQLLELADGAEDPRTKAAALRFVVVGANFTGTEVAGELNELLGSASRQYRNISPRDIRVTLIDHGRRILPALDERLSRYAEAKLRQRGVEVLLNESITAVGPESATLQSGREIPARTLVWAAGVEPSPLTRSLGLPVNERGYIVCDRDLRVRGHPEIWAIGDCAVNTDAQGNVYPATAQHATREGKTAAANIARVLRGRPTVPCDIQTQGYLAALGCRTGVAHVFGIDFSGFAAWWLWRTVYLLKMPGFFRKLRVAMDWTLQLFFRREYVQLGVHRPATPVVEPEPEPVTHGPAR